MKVAARIETDMDIDEMDAEVLARTSFVDSIMDTNDKLLTDIYVITNTITGKQYVGQANSHRLNHTKYRPFGYMRRLKDHTSEAICNRKAKQCTILNNSIRKHGKDAFNVDLLKRCLPNNANTLEQEYIVKLNTMSPTGYNVSVGGGKGTVCLEHRIITMFKTMVQFQESKLAKYRHVTSINMDNIDQYIFEYKSYGNIYYAVIIDRVKSIFVGNLLPVEDLRQRAVDFIKTLHERITLQHDQIAGTP